jgi:hypothetical protein
LMIKFIKLMISKIFLEFIKFIKLVIDDKIYKTYD